MSACENLTQEEWVEEMETSWIETIHGEGKMVFLLELQLKYAGVVLEPEE